MGFLFLIYRCPHSQGTLYMQLFESTLLEFSLAQQFVLREKLNICRLAQIGSLTKTCIWKWLLAKQTSLCVRGDHDGNAHPTNSSYGKISRKDDQSTSQYCNLLVFGTCNDEYGVANTLPKLILSDFWSTTYHI